MKIYKKIFATMLMMTFCSITAVFAADDMEEKVIRNSDVFENNYQSTKEDVFQNMSPTERMFNKKESAVSGNVLLQQGYVFNSAVSSATSTGKFGRGYKLSIGERVNVHVSGESVEVMSMSGNNLLAPSSTAEVGSNGTIFIAGIGSVQAENRTLGAVEDEINSLARSKYQDMQIKLSVAGGSGFSVFVYGEVGRPGKVAVGNNCSILDALTAAGGVKKTGTLRNIKYNKTDVDLYKSIFLGQTNNIIVKPNDIIFVDKIGTVAAVRNGVQVPGIYEMKQGETIKNLVQYAGGLLPTTEAAEITLVGFDAVQGQKTAKNIAWNKMKSTKLSSGDTLEFKELYNGVENTVTIQGNIKHPSTYAYKKGMRLSDILKSEDELLEETFLTQAVIRRISGKDNKVETIPVFLKEFFAGQVNPALEPRDVISIYKSTSSAFVDVYGCIDTPKHIPYMDGMTLKDILSDITFVASDEQNQNVDATTVFDDNSNVKTVSSVQNKKLSAEDIAVEITTGGGQTRKFYLYDIMVNGDAVRTITISPEDKVFFRTLRDNETIKKVKISGFVKNPRVYSFIKGQKLKDVIEMAGGLTEDADLRGIVFRRSSLMNKQVVIARDNMDRDIMLLTGRLASGWKQDDSSREQKMATISQLKNNSDTMLSKYQGQIALNIKNNDLSRIKKNDNIEVQDGDDIYIPRMSNYVGIIGEVYNEQSFVYKKGAHARYYVKQVGGYTPNANRFRVYKVGANGKAKKILRYAKIEKGDTIVVPRKVAGNDWLTPVVQSLQGMASVFTMVYGISKW
ncbi:MAG: SLBB domain-containing protein [Candidatus Gastranaerophilales bacterium]|nr:SLBB domain-containing protein [Candidatus Gastranaerophilales bacterium]